MANQGAKKRKDENTQHMSKLRLIIIACNFQFNRAVRLLITHASFTWKHWIGLVITSLGYGVPSVTDYGELIDGGSDMTTAGMCGYLHDVLYITCFVQLGSIISGKFWYANYLVIHAFGTYKASGLIKEFLSLGSEGGVEDEKTLAKRGRRWREKLLEVKSSRQDHDECLKHHL